ncbi:MAG: hypothetical protein Pg6C_02770 [Treponemataceae bacterium]|nr:MAG: hypothetical protein Pg6C_02770 [Treponemataceae bacterium]
MSRISGGIPEDYQPRAVETACGRVTGLCEAAAQFVIKGRNGIALSLLTAFYVGRGTAKAALQPDRRGSPNANAHVTGNETG